MKFLKLIPLGILIFLLLFFAGSFFISSKVHVQRSATIQAPPEKVFEQINTLKNWENWSPWHRLDPNMALQYDGPAEGVGGKYTWTSQQRNVGSGSLTITRSVPHERIETAMDFREQGTATASFELKKAGDGTAVTWAMDTDMGRNPISKYFGLLMDRMVGADFERGLNNLKTFLESKGGDAAPPASASAP